MCSFDNDVVCVCVVQTIEHVMDDTLILCFWGGSGRGLGGGRKMMMEKRPCSNIFVSTAGHLHYEEIPHEV